MFPDGTPVWVTQGRALIPTRSFQGGVGCFLQGLALIAVLVAETQQGRWFQAN